VFLVVGFFVCSIGKETVDETVLLFAHLYGVSFSFCFLLFSSSIGSIRKKTVDKTVCLFDCALVFLMGFLPPISRRDSVVCFPMLLMEKKTFSPTLGFFFPISNIGKQTRLSRVLADETVSSACRCIFCIFDGFCFPH